MTDELDEPGWARLYRIFDQGAVIALDRDGTEISNFLWLSLLRGDPDYASVCRTTLVDLDVEVSTVWLGSPPGRAQFETMILGGPLDEEADKYATEDEALTGHARSVLRAMRAGA